MRKLTDIDHEIYRAEKRLAHLRDELNVNLETSRLRARRTLSSPRVLLSAVVAGFLLDRLSRRKPHRGEDRRARGSSGMAGIAAGLAAAALRAAVSNPSMWRNAKHWWDTRKAEAQRAVQHPPTAAPTSADVMPFRASQSR